MYLWPIFSHADGGEVTFQNPIKAKSIEALIFLTLNFVVRIGTIVVVLMIIYSGFLFVRAQGNPGEIDKAKSTFFWTIIGGIVLIGAKTIAVVICNTAVEVGAVANCSWTN